MHIDTAINTIKHHLDAHPPTPDAPLLRAIKMSLSATIQIRLWREHGYPEFEPLLDGETQDEQP